MSIKQINKPDKIIIEIVLANIDKQWEIYAMGDNYVWKKIDILPDKVTYGQALKLAKKLSIQLNVNLTVYYKGKWRHPKLIYEWWTEQDDNQTKLYERTIKV